jgi:hypothetical protein
VRRLQHGGLAGAIVIGVSSGQRGGQLGWRHAELQQARAIAVDDGQDRQAGRKPSRAG